jgi:Na+-translocating ferredoxin:NAD+ oxidoreductase RNF subunit RnfB
MGIPALVIGSIGLLFGLLLGYAGKLFDVKEDPRVFAIREALPGANDGGCGFSGCDAFAAAVAEGKAKVTGCPVGGSAVAARISEIMGVAASGMKRKTAFVKCGGRTDVTAWRYEYNGLRDCAAMDTMPGGGPKDCLFGCLGGGNCERACQFGAISMRGGIAVVDRTKCTACGMCVAACPRALIELVDEDKTVRVACNSKDSGKRVMSVCKAGCIGCKMCQRACQYGAIVMDGTLARVDYEKCVKCGACAEKCRTGAILDINGGAR